MLRSRSSGWSGIFGIRWTVAQVRPWILDAIEAFGPRRCMFASHMPICRLACTFRQLYDAYLEVIDGCSPAEKRQLMRDTAASVYTSCEAQPSSTTVTMMPVKCRALPASTNRCQIMWLKGSRSQT